MQTTILLTHVRPHRRSVRKSSRDIRANNIAITNTNVSSEQKVKLLGINVESRLNFDYHVNTLLNKANTTPSFSKGMQLHEH